MDLYKGRVREAAVALRLLSTHTAGHLLGVQHDGGEINYFISLNGLYMSALMQAKVPSNTGYSFLSLKKYERTTITIHLLPCD